MKIEIGGYTSVSFGEKGLLQLFAISGDNGIEVKLNDFSCFWAFVDVGENDFKVVMFPDESWFKDWVKAQSQKVKIIQTQGIT